MHKRDTENPQVNFGVFQSFFNECHEYSNSEIRGNSLKNGLEDFWYLLHVQHVKQGKDYSFGLEIKEGIG